MCNLNDKVIEIKDLKMSYGNKEVLKGINLEIRKGNIIGYIGPNGAGKSTTVKIILGLVKGFTGEVKVFGQDISNGDESYKKKIGYVPEVPEIYDSLTGKEYLTFIGQLYGFNYYDVNRKAKKLMRVLGIEEVYNKRISSYSKGMKQKLIIISSLLHNPDILFLDEPLSGLDANSVMIIKEILAELSRKGKTIFYSSHIMEVVEKISDRIVLINNGNIVADGAFDELQNSCKEGTLEEIFNELTGFNDHKELAENFISIVEEV
ncbi:ABC transporter ATP-binding protein [Clostridium septicum]|uniref:ABC transporter ATP-binding protein n=1 Tax=Clostridium septicum TaxID=1504 RepID=A0A9N7JPF1_CLOSE|nr:ABC transporter ATP-binding protein [Clostridium septicum]AYE35377.1 ABC transporter ATP-binding protein [Clostridium septicum]MDU1315239.1 ABC transporter ATP-binding protein [Clostridium septicum]QAS60767.1 ABC transporter ATP-binding protein [Clostridium septicum]UEC19968.1 ABC transporter ATP-binding protein [Clostridium septicum]USS01973.1 ABC transporter ATP-binding protein [Clostridium septicum]